MDSRKDTDMGNAFDTDAVRAMEARMHEALKKVWPHVNTPWVSDTAKSRVGKYALAEDVSGKTKEMLFALQASWPFAHASGDQDLKKEVHQTMRAANALLMQGVDLSSAKLSIPKP